MEYIKKAFVANFNIKSFIWCFTLPIFTFAVTMAVSLLFTGPAPRIALGGESLRDFLGYYDRYIFREFILIFANNYFAALVVVFFSPLALRLRSVWERRRKKSTPLSRLEKTLLYLFPGLFLIRQSVNIAVVLSVLAGQMNRTTFLALAGLILPHGLPELLAFSLAGALGMEVTRKLIEAAPAIPWRGLVGAKVLAVMTAAVAFCAFLEVYLTPKVFALLVSLAG